MTTYVFVPPLVAFVISVFTSTAGISGAFLLLPFQISVLGFTTPSVSATNLLYNVIGTPGGVYRYSREGRLAWPVAAVVIAGLIPGMLAGYYLRVTYLPQPQTFKLFVGIVLAAVGLRLLLALLRPGAGTAPGRPERVHAAAVGLWRTRFRFGGRRLALSTPALWVLGAGVGAIGGAYGIGGGAIVAPLLVTVFRLPVHAIAGAVLLATFTSSAAGVAFYSLVPIDGAVAPPDWALGVLFGIGGVLGMYTGAIMQRRLPERAIKLLLALIALAVAGRYVLQFFSG